MLSVCSDYIRGVWSELRSDGIILDLTGTFTYLESSDLRAGTSILRADYNNDRIVFYDPNDQTKMIGFVSV